MWCAAHQPCYILVPPMQKLCDNSHRAVCRCPLAPDTLCYLYVVLYGRARGIRLFLRQLRRLYRRVMSSLVLGEAPRGGGHCVPPPRPIPSAQTTKHVSCGPGFRATQGRELCVTSRLPAAWNLRPNDSYWDHFWPFLCLCNGISQRYRSRMIER